jgi:TRAP-type C4-dicarboxylate transport system permease small subunit
MIRFSLKFINWIEKICMSGAILAVLAIMLLTNADVVLRKTVNQAIYGLYGITEEYLMVALVFLSISYVYSKGGHVRVTLFEKYIPKSAKMILDKILEIMALAYFILLAVAGWQATFEAWEYNEISSSGLGYPLAPAIFMVFLGCATASLRILISLLGGESASEH